MTLPSLTRQLDPKTQGSAVFSADMTHRFELRRVVTPQSMHKVLVSIGLNPSTADAFEPDNTVTKECGFAQRWGCSLYIKLNTETFRATDPDELRRQRLRATREGAPPTWVEYSDTVIRTVLADVRTMPGTVLLAAWGAHVHPIRQQTVAAIIRESGLQPMCLGTNKDGSPTHSLYIPYTRPLEDWSEP